MDKLFASHHFRSIMYILFSLGIFFSIAVRASNGGIFGERFVPIALNYGLVCFAIAAVMWLVSYRFTKKQ